MSANQKGNAMRLSRIMAAVGGCHFQNAEMLPSAAPALLATNAYTTCQRAVKASIHGRASQASDDTV